MRRSLWSLLVCAGLIVVARPDLHAQEAATAASAPMAGFTATTLGFQRLPAADAHYRHGDFEVAGGADPRWNPWNPAHLARAAAQAADPRSVRKATQLAYLRSLRGDRAGAEAGLARARARFPDSVGLHWSEGWIRLNLLDFEGALVAWQQAERLHGGQPFWVPYSKAVALIGVGDDEAALAWWKLAQASYRPSLDTPDGARNQFQHWRFTEKILLEELIQLAWPGSQRRAAVDGAGFLEMVKSPMPLYPRELLRRGIEGEVLVRFQVQPDGVPSVVKIERSSGHADFDTEALRVARLARFRLPPGTQGVVWALVPYRYSLRAAPAPAPGA